MWSKIRDLSFPAAMLVAWLAATAYTLAVAAQTRAIV